MCNAKALLYSMLEAYDETNGDVTAKITAALERLREIKESETLDEEFFGKCQLDL